jgi:hypothetical protein
MSSAPAGSISTKSKSTTLHKRGRKTDNKAEIKLRRDRAIVDNISTYSQDQFENSQKITRVKTSAAPSPNISLKKMPTARELLTETMYQLHDYQGTKQEILDLANRICPQASLEVNKAFYKTLEQSLSKYL